jgi:hypothetical protein
MGTHQFKAEKVIPIIDKRSLTLNQSASKIAINHDETLLAVGGTSIDIVEIKTWKVIKVLYFP